MKEFNYTPANGFRDTTAYPNPANEIDTRNQFQTPLDQVRDYINSIATKYGDDVVKFRIGPNKELQFSIDGSNWISLPGLDFEVVEEW